MVKRRMRAMFWAGVLTLILFTGCGSSREMTVSSENPTVGDTVAETENT